MDEADAITDAWVGLADGQRRFGSFLLAEENRAAVYETVSRGIVTGGVLVARDPQVDDDASTDVVGFVMFSPETGVYEQAEKKGVVENLYVEPGRRGEGIGSALLSAAEDALRADGAAVVILDVMAENEDARRFYEAHGFRPHRVTMAKADETDKHTRRHD
nr:GNAT family N-acetyltransferase [Halomarina sp. BCD28]